MLLIIITLMFIFYCSGESFANVARHAGSVTEHFPLGLMLSNQVYSINRLNGFLIAPLLGLYVDKGGGEEELKVYALIGCLASALMLIIFLRVWPSLLRFCVRLLLGIERHGFSLKVIKGLVAEKIELHHDFSSKKKDILIVIGQSLTTSLSMPTAFILNILAIRYPQYQASLVQSATAISGFGNLILNFYIFPRMALSETRGNPDHVYYSAMIGKIVGIGIVSTCAIIII